jgi:double-stranded RNA-binding protein Staufen
MTQRRGELEDLQVGQGSDDFYPDRALEVLKPLTLDTENAANKSMNGSENESENGDDSLINSDIKSPISIVHEMALKRKLTVSFEVQSEKGPPHMKVYTTLCKVGTIVVSWRLGSE